MLSIETEEQVARALIDWEERMINTRCELDEDEREGEGEADPFDDNDDD